MPIHIRFTINQTEHSTIDGLAFDNAASFEIKSIVLNKAVIAVPHIL